MHILIFAQHFFPEEISGAVLATELAKDLVSSGHKVSLVTCAPNHPLGKVFSGYKNKILSRTFWENIHVIRTWCHIHPPTGFIHRLFNYGSFSATSFYGGLAAGKPDIIFCYSPPLPMGLSAWLLSRFWNVPWVFRVEDLYPDAAIAAGVLKNKSIIRFFYRVEKFLYRSANHISLISEGFKESLLRKGVDALKMSVIPVWADPDIVKPSKKNNRFREKLDLQNKFIVMYAGNMGHASAIENIINAAIFLRDKKEIHFLLIGEGVKKEGLKRLVHNKKLDNVLFLPYQPRDQFSEMMAAADMNLVTLNSRSSNTSLPSKTFNIMASERPILAVTPVGCDIERLVSESQCGINVIPDSPMTLAETILMLSDKKTFLSEMGRKGREKLISDFSRKTCIDQFEDLLLRLAK